MLKLTFITIFIFALLNTTVLLLDYLVGIPFNISLENTLNPFWVIGPGELVILILFIMIAILIQTIKFYKTRTKNQ